MRVCSIDRCGRRHHARDLCGIHYSVLRRGGELPESKIPRPVVVECPDDLLPIVAQVVDIDAARLFRVCWRWLGEQHLSRMEQAS